MGQNNTTNTVPPLGMSTQDFRKYGKQMVDFIADYYDNVEEHRVRSEVDPGYLVEALPASAPEKSEKFETIMNDVEKLILPGVTHFQSPNMFAYFPASSSYPSMLGDMLCNAFNMIGFSWINGPALTELEFVTMNWLRELLALPEFFKDNGVIQGTASDATFVSILIAREKALTNNKDRTVNDLVCYCTDQAHTSYMKGFKLAGIVNVRVLETSKENNYAGKGDALRKLIEKDVEAGLVPFFVGVTHGTTGICTFDDLTTIGPVAREFDCWVHVDAAYAGTAYICPEFRDTAVGLEYSDSFAFNPHKWMLVNFDCSVLWVKDRLALTSAMSMDFEIYANEASKSGRVIDYRDWQVPLGRRFRALKLWFVLRSFGVEGLQNHVRRHTVLAKHFESLVLADSRFELAAPTKLGLVCFKVACDTVEKSNEKVDAIIAKLNEQGKIFVTHSSVHDEKFIRFVLCSALTNEKHVEDAFEAISKVVTSLE